MKKKYFYFKQNGKILGPANASSLDAMIRAGTLSADTPVSTDKLSWKPLKEVFYVEFDRGLTLKEANTEPDPEPVRKKKEEIDFSAEPFILPDAEPSARSFAALNPVEPYQLEDPVLILGRTLHLIWNAAEKLPELMQIRPDCIGKFFLPLSFGFSLLVTQAAAASIAFFFGGYLQKMLFMLILILAGNLLFLIEAEILHAVIGTKKKQNWMNPLLLSGMLWINMGSLTCIGALYYAMNVLPGPGAMPLWVQIVSGLFTLFAGCFFAANTVNGLNVGFRTFYGLHPRHGIWGAALFLWQFILLAAAAKIWIEKLM